MSLFDKIIMSIKDRTFFKKVFHKIKVMSMMIIRKIIEKRIQIDNKKILFITFQGNYSCNPKAIANEFLKQKKDYNLIWAIRKENCDSLEQYPKELTLIKRNTIKFYKEAASAKFIIDNANNFEYLKMHKKEGQILLQPWHGSMGFKKLETNSNEKWLEKAKKLDEITDYCITNSDFEVDVFRNSFWPTTKMLKYGHPRNDILFNKNGEFDYYSKKIKEKYNIDEDTKIALYAPTFRDYSTFETFGLDYINLYNALEKRFGGKWCIMVRFHFKLRNAVPPKKYLKKVINVTNYPDMQELLCAIDLGITDYSSWMCDFVLTGKPGFLFFTDFDNYCDERGFYYPLSSTPFAIAKSNNELADNILNFDEKKYEKSVKKFLKDRGCFEKGEASKKVVKKIEKLSKK